MFRGRLLDARDRDTSVERCELSIQEGTQRAECRLVVKMFCKHGKSSIYILDRLIS